MILNSSQVKTKTIKALKASTLTIAQAFIVFVLTWLEFKIMIYCTEGEHFNHYTSFYSLVKTKTIKACVMIKVLAFSAVDHDFEF
jgi:hypothetical protein